jgi:hypothetical protein
MQAFQRRTKYSGGTTRITDCSLELLGQMLSLERVLVSYCAGITNAGVAALAKLPRLREGVLRGCRLLRRRAQASFPLMYG